MGKILLTLIMTLLLLFSDNFTLATYYGKSHNGRLTASGERFNMNSLTAAHKTLVFGTKVKVTNIDNDKSVIVKINDRGPFAKGRELDLSSGAFSRIASLKTGVIKVKYEILN